MDEFFEDIKFLASFVGCNIFEIIKFKDEHIFIRIYRTERQHYSKHIHPVSQMEG